MKVEYLMVMHVVVMNHIMWNGMVWCEGNKAPEWTEKKTHQVFRNQMKKYMHQGDGGERMFSLLRGFGFSILSFQLAFYFYQIHLSHHGNLFYLLFVISFSAPANSTKKVQTFRGKKNTLCAMEVCGLTGRDKKILIQPSWHCATQQLISWIFAHLWCDNNFFKNISAICVPFSLHLVVDVRCGARASSF